MSEVVRELATAEDTHHFGVALGRLLRAGDLVLLSGPLGAGKTALTKGIGAGMGLTTTITSPTFVIARIHRPTPEAAQQVPLIHMDAYRLGSPAEVDDLDLDHDLSATVVEWGDGVAEQLADAHLRIELDRHPDDSRSATLTGTGRWTALLPELAGT